MSKFNSHESNEAMDSSNIENIVYEEQIVDDVYAKEQNAEVENLNKQPKEKKNKNSKQVKFNFDKISLYRGLQIFFYLLGFPLLFLMIYTSAAQLNATDGSFSIKSAVIPMVIVWLVITIAQLIFNSFFKKFSQRSIFIVVITLIIMLLTAFIAHSTSKKAILKASEEYKDANVPDYRKQVNFFMPYTKGTKGFSGDYATAVQKYLRAYNSGIKSSAIRPGQNTDKSKSAFLSAKDIEEQLKKRNPKEGVIKLKEKGQGFNYFFEGDAYYNVTVDANKKEVISNGLFADGYIFDIQRVYDIIYIDATVKAFFRENPQTIPGGTEKTNDPDIYLAAAYDQLIKDTNSAWNKYKETSIEYKINIGNKGNYEIDQKRVDAIIKALLHSFNVTLTGADEGLDLVSTIAGLIGLDSAEKILGIIGKIAPDLTLDKVMALLAGFSSYTMPSIVPQMMFLSNAQFKNDAKNIATGISLRDYAMAQYYGRVHGGNIGSVILPNDSGKIGKITMDTQGVVASENQMSAQELYQLKVDASYKPQVYPRLIVRRYFFMWFGPTILFLILATFFGVKSQSEIRKTIKREAIAILKK